MSANTNTDLTEEDAADLQFPKENAQIPVVNTSIELQSECLNCYNELNAPFINCVECDISICCACFAKGSEFGNHKNSHKYCVFQDDFVLFKDSNWTAKEEIILLEELKVHQNWNLIAKQMPNRTIKEIQEHYYYYYLDNKCYTHFPNFPKSHNVLPEIITPYRFKIVDVPDPPRYSPGTISYNSVAGYNAPRSDFEIKYDLNAEDLVVPLQTLKPTETDFNLMSELHCAIIRIYNRRLWERARRNKIIKHHGLIMLRKTTSWLHRYDITITQSVYDRLIHFMQFYSGDGFEKLMEGLHRVSELKNQIARLCEIRKKGISSLEGAQLFINLKQKYDENSKELKMFHNHSLFKYSNKSMPAAFSTKKRSSFIFTPLDIIGMPGYEKLQPKEKELCRNVRLVPLTYLELKDILISENNKTGSLKLLTARRLLKIDVNKTRKLYDFLVTEGFINKPR